MYKSINEIVTQHFESVGELFLQYGLENVPVNENTLAAAIKKYGDDFAEDLEDEILADFAGFKDKESRQQSKADKKASRAAKKGDKQASGGTGKSKFVEFLKGNAGDILSGLAGGITGAIANRKRSDTTDTPSEALKSGQPLSDSEQKAKAKKTFNLIAIISLAGLAILVIVLMATGGNKKIV